MAELKYTKEHECIYLEGDTAWIGISEHARDALGDLVFVELPEVGKNVDKGENVAVVESVKTAAEIYAPLAGEIVETNDAMADDFDLIAQPVNDNGWIVKLKVTDSSSADLMDESAYAEYLKEVD